MPWSAHLHLAAAATEAAAGNPLWHGVAIAFAGLGEALGLLFVARIVTRGGAPASTLLWVGVILLAPWIGLLLYYLFPRRLQLRRLRRLRSNQERWRGELRQARGNESSGTVPRMGPLCRLLQGIAHEDLSTGNRARWLPSGGDFFAAAALAIESARTFVHVQVYIFRSDGTGRHLLALLAAAARRGVEVRLLYDSFGSWGLKAAHLAELRAAGGRAEAFLPLLWKRRPFTVNLRNHRKLIVVDGTVAFTGGRNIADEYAQDRFGNRRTWLDAMVQIEGPAVNALHEVFAEDWFHATDEELTDGRYYPPPANAGHDVIGVVGSGPDRDQQQLWLALLQAIGEAQQSIQLSSPYLVPPPSLLVGLELAAARGVRVRIFTNGERSEAMVLHHAQRSYYRELVGLGIEIHETIDDYNHAKVVVVDGRTVMIGSANMDMRSAHLNFELAVVLPDSPDFAQAVLATLEERSARSRRVVVDAARTSRLQHMIDGFCRLLSPLL